MNNNTETPKLFFYVDESGNTGTNLFDEKQLMLHYGVLCSQTDLDISAKDLIKSAKNYLGVSRLHANELGFKGLESIVDYLYEFDEKYIPWFGIYSVKKIDFALICFFDQVFDQGINPAMTWSGYWTPLRYVLLFKIAMLFDIDLLQKAWAARIELDDEKSSIMLSQICDDLLVRIRIIPDERSRKIISDTLHWAGTNPDKLSYNCENKDEILSVAPNIIGFQSVMHSIADKIGSPDIPARIIVDHQSQFNKAQQTLADYYKIGRDKNPIWEMGPGLPVIDLSNIPKIPIEFKSSHESVGLELVDIYLWLSKQIIEGNIIKGSLKRWLARRALTFGEGEVSLNALHNRWKLFFNNLPVLSPEREIFGREMIQKEEERRIKVMNEFNK